MTDPLSAYIHRSFLVDSTGTQSEGVNKVANYVWDSNQLAWIKSSGGSGVGTSVIVTNFPTTQPVSLSPTATQYDQSTSTLAYLGTAPAGSLLSASVWAIQQLTFAASGGVSILWANGNTSNTNVWANRASLSYS